MTPRNKHRVALFICLLLVGQEFTHARHLKNQFHKHQDEKNEDIEENTDYDKDQNENGEEFDGDDYTQDELENCKRRTEELAPKKERATIPHPLVEQLHRQPLKEESGGRKGWINPSQMFKAIKIFSTGVGFVSSLGTVAHSIKMAIVGCCDAANQEACAYKDKYKDAGKELKNLSTIADDLQLNAELAQMWIEKSTDLFEKILNELERIDALETLLIQEISPDYANATLTAQDKIKQLIKEKNGVVNGIPFVDVDALFQNTVQKVLGVGGSMLALAIPTIFAVYQYSSYKARMRRLGYIELEEEVDFKLPKSSSSSYEETKFKRYTSRRWKIARIKYFITDVKNTFKRGFQKVKKYASKFAGAIGVVTSLAAAGYSIYSIIKAEQECADTRKNIKCAYIQTKEALKTVQRHIDEIRNTSQVMMDGWKIMRGNLTEKMFLKSVSDTGKMMEGAAQQSAETQRIADDVTGFVTEIKTSDNFNVTYDASEKLLQALGKIPYSLKCYTNKINTLNKVVYGCMEGDYTINTLIEKSKQVPGSIDPNDVNDPRNCRDRLGFLYIEDKNIKAAWYNRSQEEGYHRLCLMNKKLNREYICKSMKMDLMDAEQIANAMHWEKDGVQDVMNFLKTSFSPTERRGMCRQIQRYEQGRMDEDALHQRLQRFYKQYKLEDMLKVKCPAPKASKNEGCIMDDAFSEKQLERERQQNEGE